MTQPTLTRRHMLGLCGAITLGTPSILPAKSARAAAKIRLLETKVISPQAHLYSGWPTLTRRSNGELIVVCSGGRQAHVCPFGRVEMMRSRDDGQTWSWPRTLLDSAIDDRDAGVLETEKGTLLVTTFTSLAFEPILARAEKGTGNLPAEKLAKWKAARDRLSPEQRKKELGVWMLRSTDGGANWSSRYRVPVNSPHGPIQAKGRLIYAGKELWHGQKRIGVSESTDDGKSWKWLSQIPTRSGDNPAEYHELHAVETDKGKLIVHVRNHNKANSREILQATSEDGGKTWSDLKSIDVWGLPSHLLRLRDGRLLMSYGYRRPPFGNQVRLSEDDGATWSAPLTLSGDGIGVDLGYPSTVELKDGSFVSVWYEKMRAKPHAVLRQAHWKLEA